MRLISRGKKSLWSRVGFNFFPQICVTFVLVMNSKITIAQSEQEILDCYLVMAELRPDIQPDEFLPVVRRLTEVAGFQLAYLM